MHRTICDGGRHFIDDVTGAPTTNYYIGQVVHSLSDKRFCWKNRPRDFHESPALMARQNKRTQPVRKPASNLAKELGMKSEFDLIEREVFLNLVKSFACLTAQFDQLFADFGISPIQYNVLRILRGHAEAISVGQISGEMVVGHPDVPRLVDRLTKMKLVSKRKCDADRRVVWVSITRKGTALLNKMDAPIDNLHHEQFQHMTAKQLKTLNELLYVARQSSTPE